MKHKKSKWMTSALLKSINIKINYTKSGLKQMYIMLNSILDSKRNLSHTITLFDAV